MDEQARTYPNGVTSWIDTEQPDPEAAARFYEGLFGWTLTEAMPPGAPGSYLIATLDGKDAAAVAPGDGPPRWNTYVAVDDCDATAAAVTAAGGQVVFGPEDAGPAGRMAICTDPAGAELRLWQAGRRLGAQVTNTPGAWNFSDLHTPDVAGAHRFYSTVFGWELDPEAGGMIRVPGYGDHLESTVDPEIRTRQAFAPPGFADVIGAVEAVGPDEPAHWSVTFTVADRDAAVARAVELDADVVSSSESQWTRAALIRDPQGAELVLSQFTPPA